MRAAVRAALQQRPRDVLDLLDALQKRAGSILARHEGSLHPLLHSMVLGGAVSLAAPSERGLIRYALAGREGGATDAPDPVPADPASPVARAAERIASGLRATTDRVRVQADVAAHLLSLGEAGRERAFGSRRTVRHYLRRADRSRPSVFFAADLSDGLRRFVVHEGPWILVAVIVFLVVRAFVAEVFRIPSGSMIPTLLPGDRVVVYKPGGSEMPERWTIYTFERWGTTYVKRAVGLGGEKIALVGGDVYIDGKREAMPAELREVLRAPYADWDFVEDADVWAKTTDSAAGWVTWTYNDVPLWSSGLAGIRSSTDVRLRDVYATFEIDLAEREEVHFELVYDRPGGSVSGEPVVIGLIFGTHMLGLKYGPPYGASGSLTSFPPPTAGRATVRLSYVDGIIRGDVAGNEWEIPFEVPPGFVVTPRIRVQGSGNRPIRLHLDRDHHYTRDGHLALPDAGSDESPTSYAFEIPAGHVFFLGDNSHNSRDSRYRADPVAHSLGPVPVEDLIGPVVYRILPPGRIGTVR